MDTHATFNFDNSYARLPGQFYSRQEPVPVPDPGPIRVNHALAIHLGINPDWLESAQGTRVIAGNELPGGAQPLASVYAGHQFGSWNPQLGDGRAVLLGEVIAQDGERYDIQLKGSGPTPYSRGGDGRSPLGPVLREYVVSEAMAARGIPTSRALAAVTTGATVAREQLLPGAILARVARSHIRIGTVQFFASRSDHEALQILVEHVLARHYPQYADAELPALALLEQVIAAQASLVAQWQCSGFIHGVMNTDNMLLSAETIDYGPCAFMDAFNPDQVYSSIDHQGRYAYRNQPGIAHWNLAALAQALLPLLGKDAVERAQAAVDTFSALFLDAHGACMRKKLGIISEREGDEELVRDLLTLMSDETLDFTLCFRHLADLADPDRAAEETVGELFQFPASGQAWLQRWRERLAADPLPAAERQLAMYRANPVFIPRNHLVEEAIRAASDGQDFAPFHRLVERLARPFDYSAEDREHALPPRPEQVVRQTFCGT